jgi:Holliday junction resolvase RusA-like endonuclease
VKTLRVVVLSFFVQGTPVPQGSKKAWYNAKTRQVQMYEDAGVRHSTWRHEVSGYARQAMADAHLVHPLTDALLVHIEFRLQRPANHYGTGRNANTLKPSAPAFPAKVPDIDKLTRSIFDSMTSIVFVDDSQVVTLNARKRWADRFTEQEGVKVAIALEVPDHRE